MAYSLNPNSKGQEAIREQLQHLFPQWGFSIVRCTYTSQERWDKYLSLIRADIKSDLAHPRNFDLREALNIPIIENKEALEGATWKQARSKFDKWVISEFEKRPGSEGSWQGWKRTVKFGIPRFEFFIFADKASVDSVVDCKDNKDRTAPGSYYFTIVATGLKHTRERCVTTKEDLIENGTYTEDAEIGAVLDPENCELRCGSCECMRAYWQKLRAYNYVHLYAFMPREWPDFFWPPGDDGISQDPYE